MRRQAGKKEKKHGEEKKKIWGGKKDRKIKRKNRKMRKKGECEEASKLKDKLKKKEGIQTYVEEGED